MTGIAIEVGVGLEQGLVLDHVAELGSDHGGGSQLADEGHLGRHDLAARDQRVAGQVVSDDLVEAHGFRLGGTGRDRSLQFFQRVEQGLGRLLHRSERCQFTTDAVVAERGLVAAQAHQHAGLDQVVTQTVEVFDLEGCRVGARMFAFQLFAAGRQLGADVLDRVDGLTDRVASRLVVEVTRGTVRQHGDSRRGGRRCDHACSGDAAESHLLGVHGKFSCLLTLSRARTHEERTAAHFLPDVRGLCNVQLVVNTNTP